LRLGARLLADVVQETAVGQAGVGVIRVALEKAFVTLDDWLEAPLDARIENGLLDIRLGLTGAIALLDPFVDFRLCRIVGGHELPVGLLDGIVDINDCHRHAGAFLHQIADRSRRVGRHQRAQQADKQIVHERKLAQDGVKREA